MKTFSQWINEHSFDDRLYGDEMSLEELARQIKVYASSRDIRTHVEDNKVVVTGPFNKLEVEVIRNSMGSYMYYINGENGEHLNTFNSESKIKMLDYLRKAVSDPHYGKLY